MASKRQRLVKDLVDQGNATSDASETYRNTAGIRPAIKTDEYPVRKEHIDMILLHKYPLSIVDHVGFQKLLCSDNPRSKMVSRKQVKEGIIKTYILERKKHMKGLNDIMCRIAVSMDLWTSHDERRHFVAASAHYIDDNWIPRSCLFEFRALPSEYTDHQQMETYFECLYKWKLDQKLSTLTFDDCFTDKFLKETYFSGFDCEKLILGGKFLRMRCFWLTLKSLVDEALGTLGDAIIRIQDSVAYWTTTYARRLKFNALARQLGVPYEKKLVYCNGKRWDSVYLMLESALRCRDVFKNEKLNDSGYTCIPTEEDWNLTKEICGPLKLFYDTAMYFSDYKYNLTNEYFHKVCDIKLALSKWVTSEVEVVRSMASNMIDNFDEYWNEVNTMLAVIAILDPRYTMHLVEYYFTKIYKDEAQGEINRVRKVFYELFEEYRSKVRLVNPQQQASGTQWIIRQDMKDPMSAFDVFVTETKKASVITELDYYLDEEIFPRVENFNLLLWWAWHVNGLKYPTMAMIARDVLAIPVSKMSVSATFYTDDNVLEKNFDKLSERVITAIMCKRNWLTAEFPGYSPCVLEEGEDSDYESP